jgi:hypothetical protein
MSEAKSVHQERPDIKVGNIVKIIDPYHYRTTGQLRDEPGLLAILSAALPYHYGDVRMPKDWLVGVVKVVAPNDLKGCYGPKAYYGCRFICSTDGEFYVRDFIMEANGLSKVSLAEYDLINEVSSW